MKKAFTLLELVFTIVIIGILAANMIPNIKTNSIQEAGIQLVSHIRYTQHLAMVDDKYDKDNDEWYKARWQLKFSIGEDTNNKYSYVIFSDTSGSGNPDPHEVAVNPLDGNKKLTGGTTGASMIHSGESEATAEMNIGEVFGVLDVDFSSACRTGSTSKNLLFDSFGRPLRGNDRTYTSSYNSGGATNILIESGCTITICSVGNCNDATNEEKVVIAIEEETGYTHIL